MAEENLRDAPTDEDELPPQPQQTPERDRELIGDKNFDKELLKLYADIEKGFSDQWDRANAQMDYWDIYDCILGPKQFYSGNSKVYVPICHDAVNARVTRFVNQMFPHSAKHIEVMASEDKPTAIMSLLEFYIRKAKLRTQVFPALIRNGDVEGQYNLYVRWVRNERNVAMRVQQKRKIDDMEVEGDDYEDIVEQTIVHQYPVVEVIPDSDVLVMPFTCDSIEGALDNGGSVTIIRRWSKAKIRQMIRDGDLDQDAGEDLLKEMVSQEKHQTPSKNKTVVDAAGIKTEGGKQVALIYETWTKMKVEGERRIVRVFFGGPEQLLGCKLNPYWCDKVPLLSAPVEKVQGSFKGMSKLKFVDTIQYAANDIINQGFDSATYSLLPIIMTDPEKNPRTGSMVLNVAAIWETSPQHTQFAQFPQLWKEAFQIAASCKEQIFQTLGVNPAMLPQQVASGTKKMNQAQIAAEQQVDLLTTADAVTVIESEEASPLLQWFLWLDHQFRDEDVVIPAFGDLGVQIEMQKIAPIQMDRRFEFRWYGVEAARSMQQMQMQMAGINVLMGIPKEAMPGKQIDVSPIVESWVETAFGPRVANRVFKDIRSELTLDPKFEDKIMATGQPMPVSPLDNDAEHLKAHMQAFQETGDFSGVLREHMQMHQIAMQQKQQQAMMQQMQQQQGPQQQQQGPRRGGKPGGARPNGQGPPGMIHADQMRNAMPRPRQGGTGGL